MNKYFVGFVGFMSLIFVSVVQADTYSYTVQNGDTLSNICIKTERCKYSFNDRDRLSTELGLPNLDLIHPGQILKLPRLYRVEWTSLQTGYKSFGEWTSDKKSVKGAVDQANIQFPNIGHEVGVK